MPEKKRVQGPPPQVAQRFLPWLLVLFVGSGAAALIYEVVWFQLLELVIGATAVSLGVLLTTFMGGMCAGSLLLSRFAARRHPLRLYAQLELGIGACAMLILIGLPLLSEIYVASFGQGWVGILGRALLSGLC